MFQGPKKQRLKFFIILYTTQNTGHRSVAAWADGLVYMNSLGSLGIYYALAGRGLNSDKEIK